MDLVDKPKKVRQQKPTGDKTSEMSDLEVDYDAEGTVFPRNLAAPQIVAALE